MGKLAIIISALFVVSVLFAHSSSKFIRFVGVIFLGLTGACNLVFEYLESSFNLV